MAEAIITLSMIGIVAVVTIPSIIHKNTEARHRTMLKKAVEVYSNAIVTITSENNFRGNIDRMNDWGRDNNCSNVREYFRIVDGDDCQFKTADGVWWDFTDLSKPIVAFKQSDLTSDKAEDENSKDAFYFVTSFDNNQKARILDAGYSSGDDDNKIKSKVFTFLKINSSNNSSDLSTLTESDSTQTPEDNSVQTPEDTSEHGSFMSTQCTKNADNETYTCDGIDATFYPEKFTDECTLLDITRSCPDSTNPTVVALISPVKSWNEAQSACPRGTHLAKMAEIKQLWSNRVGKSILEVCDYCQPYFWAAEESTNNPDKAYYFSLTLLKRYDISITKKSTEVTNGFAVCVGD